MANEAPSYDSIAAYYDLMLPDRTPVIAHYAALIAPGQRSLLDLGCGTGIITAALAQRLREGAEGPGTETPEAGEGEGVRVVGLDGSAGMLAVARARDGAIDWRLGDMRAIPPDCGPVELAVCCQSSLQHLDPEGLGQALRGVRAVLAPGGRFAFDLYRPNLPYLRIARRDTRTRVFDTPDGRRLEIREDSHFDDAEGTLHLVWRVVPEGRPEAPPLARMAHRGWQHTPETVTAALAAAGFEILARWGDLDRSPWHGQARKQVIVCRAA